MEDFMLQLAANMPNFAGFLLMGFFMWKINQRQIELVDRCLEKLE